MISQLLKHLTGLPEVTTLVHQSQIKRQTQGIPDPRNERRLNPGTSGIQTNAEPDASGEFVMHDQEVADPIFDGPAGARCQRLWRPGLHPVRRLEGAQNQAMPPMIGKRRRAVELLPGRVPQSQIPLWQIRLTSKHQMLDTLGNGPAATAGGRVELSFRQACGEQSEVVLDSLGDG